ncbi:hypothetical protein [Spirosoma litoris]
MKNDEFHATFTLRQHTPMIHFQADQPGALLRVSELKPAFDKYLWQRVFKNNFEQGKSFIVGYTEKRENELLHQFKREERPFDYKIHISCSGPIRGFPIRKGQKYPCFFGNLGENEPITNEQPGKNWTLLLTDSDINVKIFCLHKELIILLKQHFPIFLCRKNFGTRQSKGFGSFTAVNDNGTLLLPDLPPSTDNARNLLSFTVPVNGKLEPIDQTKEVFEHISLFWMSLRNGIKLPKPVITAALDSYVHSKWKADFLKALKPDVHKELIRQYTPLAIEWDKPAIKKYVDAAKEDQQHNQPAKQPQILFRDLLGLASTTNWKHQQVTLEKDHKSGQIARFKSPIMFKPIRLSKTEFNVFVSYEPIPIEFLSQNFKLSINIKDSPTTEFSTAPYFGLSAFFQYIKDVYAPRIEKDIQRENRNHSPVIKQVLRSLKFHTPPKNA